MSTKVSEIWMSIFFLNHFNTWLILLLDFVTVTQSWMLAAASGKLYLILSGNSQLSAIIISTLLIEIKSNLIQ